MGFSIRYTAYETQAALLQQSTASLNSSEALHTVWVPMMTLRYNTVNFFSVCCNFVFHVTHIKQDSFDVLYILFL